MKIGNLQINSVAALAPMASVGDRAFRELCEEFGCSYTVSEMVSAKGILYQNKNTFELMERGNCSNPFAIQLFGNDPKTIAKAAKIASLSKPDIIDINMGCPVPKVVSNGCGSALMKDPKLCGQIVKEVKNSVSIPVTIKIRKGWDNQNINAVEVAKICEENGADAIIIHARTRQDMYSPGIDMDIIKKVKNSVSIPVIGNGDIFNEKHAATMLQKTGCDMVMVGRGALGNPFIFSKINSYVNDFTAISDPTLDEKIDVMLKHVRLICKYKGEVRGMKEARKHVSWYIKGLKNAAAFRNIAGHIETFEDLLTLADEIYKANS